jgi:predicted cobalt transporter CbtA
MQRLLRQVIAAGVLAGVLAGLAAGSLGLVAAEPVLDSAIVVEQRETGHVEASSPAPEVPRSAQKLGLVLATGLYGLAVGGLVALTFLALRGRTRHRTDAALAMTVVGALFVTVVALPFAKYPPAPPGAADPGTIGVRTQLYLVAIAGSLASLLAAWRVTRFTCISSRAGRVGAFVGTFALLGAALILALPAAEGPPSDYPSGLLREFRLASGGLQLTLWCGLALSFNALLARRRLRESRA